mgnify:FL=1
MKIDQNTTFIYSQNPYVTHGRRVDQRRIIPRDTVRSDRVEISPEARNRYEELRQKGENRETLRAQALAYMPEIRRLLSEESENREAKVASLRESVHSGNLPGENDRALGELSESLLGFIL